MDNRCITGKLRVWGYCVQIEADGLQIVHNCPYLYRTVQSLVTSEFREKEKELDEMLREAEKENARLAGQIEQLKTDLSWLPPVAQTQ